MSTRAAFDPTPLNVAIERANGGPVPPLVSDDCPVEGIVRPWQGRHLHPVHNATREPLSAIKVKAKPHDWAEDWSGTKLLTVHAGNLALSTLLAYAEKSGVRAVEDAAAEVRRGIQP